MALQRKKVEKAAEGMNLPESRQLWTVRWDPDGQNVRPGPGADDNYCNDFYKNKYCNYSNHIAIIPIIPIITSIAIIAIIAICF